MTRIDRQTYVSMFGPTTGDRVRLADTALWIEVEEDPNATELVGVVIDRTIPVLERLELSEIFK